MIVLNAWEHAPQVLFWFAMITVFMTAFYMFRVIFMTFFGEYRGGEPGHGDEHGHGAPHESPLVMVFPMVMLALMAVGCGWSIWWGGGAKFLAGEGFHAHGFFDLFTHVGEEPMPLIALAVALGGIFLAYAIYQAKWISAEAIGRTFKPVHTLLSRKYYMDELYENIIVIGLLQNGLFRLVELCDAYIVEGVVNGVGKLTVFSSSVIRKAQTGQLQFYGLVMVLGVVVIMAVFVACK